MAARDFWRSRTVSSDGLLSLAASCGDLTATMAAGRRCSDMSRTKPRPQQARLPKAKETDRKLDEALKDTFPASDPVALLQPAPAKPAKSNPRKASR